MSITVLETAETIEPGHFKFGINGGIGIDLTSPVFFREDTIHGEHKLTGFPVIEYKIGTGLADGYEINAKYLYSPYSYGLMLYLKNRLPPLGENISIAIMPGISFINSIPEDSSSEYQYSNTTAYGFNLPIIISHRFTKLFSLYAAGRYGIDLVHLTENDLPDIQCTYVLNRAGLLSGVSLEPGSGFIRLEIGLEGAKRVNGGYGYYPIVGVGMGLKL